MRGGEHAGTDDRLEDLEALGDHFRADAVAADHGQLDGCGSSSMRSPAHRSHARPAGQGHLRRCVSVTVMSNRLALEFEQRRNPHPRSTQRAGRDPRRPGLRDQLHRPHGRRDLDAGRRLARLGDRPVRTVRARPGDRGAALRAGDLRGAEGLPARRRQRLAVPAGPERGPVRPVGAPAGAAGAGAGRLPRQHRGADRRRRQPGSRRGGEQSLYLRPFMFASEAFLGVRAAHRVTYCCIASPAGLVLRLRGAAGQDLDLHRRTPGRPRAAPARPSAAATTRPAWSPSRRRPSTAATR